MQPTTIQALVIVALVLSPGYIFVQVARRILAHVPETTDLRFLLTIITYGMVIQAIAFPFLGTNSILDYYLDGQLRLHESETVRWAASVCFALPVVLGIVVGLLARLRWIDRVLDKIGMGYIDRMPSAWDYVMHQRQAGWIRIHLEDGKGMVGGVFKDRSFGSLDPQRADVYLEEAWQLDENGGFVQVLPGTSGVWVSHDAMAYAYFYEGEDRLYARQQQTTGPDNEQAPAADARYGQTGRTAGGAGEAFSASPGIADRSRPEG